MILSHKLRSSLINSQVVYHHPFDDECSLNQLIGSEISISITPQKQCLGCGKSVKKVVQGYCYLCSQRLACCDICIIKPHLCHYHQGTCREPQWGEQHCFQEHVIYLSLTSNLKVGLTRKSQFITRWIDQGATQGAILASFSSRRYAGIVEDFLSKSFNDKTNWRHLLTGQSQGIENFEEQFATMQNLIATERFEGLVHTHSFEPVVLRYPVNHYLEKAKSINLEKTPFFQDKLVGIRGQYLLFKTLGGLNLRKYQGYDITIEKTA